VSARGTPVRARPRSPVAQIGPLLRPRRRVVEILDLAALGLSDKEIARRLGLAHRTVRSHLERLYAATGVSGRTEAVAAWAWLDAIRLATRLQTGVVLEARSIDEAREMDHATVGDAPDGCRRRGSQDRPHSRTPAAPRPATEPRATSPPELDEAWS
jgi:DNA-binding CsgD family transcriptional regulator